MKRMSQSGDRSNLSILSVERGRIFQPFPKASCRARPGWPKAVKSATLEAAHPSNAHSRVWLVLPLLGERRLEAELGVSDHEWTAQFGGAEHRLSEGLSGTRALHGPINKLPRQSI